MTMVVPLFIIRVSISITVSPLAVSRLPVGSSVRRPGVRFVFQNFDLIDDLNVAENVEVALLYVGGTERRTTPASCHGP
jgi:ABC-type lipoprotein export system ATPase subunit